MVAGLSFQLAIAEMAGMTEMTETIGMTEMTETIGMTEMIDRKLGIWGHRTEQNKW
ncbi:MAG: hypothetical protein V7K59_17345 [Nostoc sp.]|nr:hypothetical protein [Nostoc sp. 'Peltigera membranacea cyanobiont' N6]